AGDNDQGDALVQGALDGAGDLLADRRAHRPAHEPVLHDRHHHLDATEGAAGVDDRVIDPRFLPVLPKPIPVRFHVAEFEGVDGVDVCVDLLVTPVVEQGGEALAGRDAEVIIALGADVGVPEDLLLIDDLLAAVALDPQPLGDLDPLVLDRLFRLADLLEPRYFHDGWVLCGRPRAVKVPGSYR